MEGEHLLDLDVSIPLQRLREPIGLVLAGGEVEDLDLGGHDGASRPLRVKVTFRPLQYRPESEQPGGAILLVRAELAG